MSKPSQSRLTHLVLHGCDRHLLPNVIISYPVFPSVSSHPPQHPYHCYSQLLQLRFSHDSDSMPRLWTGKEDIKSMTKEARSASLKLLSIVAAIRLDEKQDSIENILISRLLERTTAVSSQNRDVGDSGDPLASSSWEEVSPENTLLAPVQCKSLWRQFMTETEYTVSQAISAQEAHRQSNNWLPPPWAIVVMIILGFNKFMLLLRNPLYLFILFVLYLLERALWIQIDIPGGFRNGILAGFIPFHQGSCQMLWIFFDS